jgi:hypothetical protein
MNITELKRILKRHPQRCLRFVLPDGQTIPPHFHITEVGHAQKTFIDCAGKSRALSSCVLQAWIMPGDDGHALLANKLVQILDLAQTILPNEDLPVEVEYEAPYISQFLIESADLADDAIVFQLLAKHTACLALENCGPDCATSFCCVPENAAD